MPLLLWPLPLGKRKDNKKHGTLGQKLEKLVGRRACVDLTARSNDIPERQYYAGSTDTSRPVREKQPAEKNEGWGLRCNSDDMSHPAGVSAKDNVVHTNPAALCSNLPQAQSWKCVKKNSYSRRAREGKRGAPQRHECRTKNRLILSRHLASLHSPFLWTLSTAERRFCLGRLRAAPSLPPGGGA